MVDMRIANLAVLPKGMVIFQRFDSPRYEVYDLVLGYLRFIEYMTLGEVWKFLKCKFNIFVVVNKYEYTAGHLR